MDGSCLSGEGVRELHISERVVTAYFLLVLLHEAFLASTEYPYGLTVYLSSRAKYAFSVRE